MEKIIIWIYIITMLAAHCSSTFIGRRKSIILLAGQSNMSGRGGVHNGTWDQVVPPECHPNPLISLLNATTLQWEEAHEPLHIGVDNLTGIVGVGPGMPFATSLLAKYPLIGEIGLVPSAKGQTSITDWSRGGDLYNALVARAEAAVKLGGCLRTLLWYQGENDCNDPDSAKLYKARFERFVRDLRSDLGSPLLPIVEVAIATGGTPELREVVREAQFESAGEVERIRCVDAKGLERKPDDSVHLTTEAQVHLGQLMADAYLDICEPLPCF